MMNIDTPQPTRYRIPDVLAELKISASTLAKLRRDGKFPRPLRIGRTVGWNRAQIDDWLAELADD